MNYIDKFLLTVPIDCRWVKACKHVYVHTGIKQRVQLQEAPQQPAIPIMNKIPPSVMRPIAMLLMRSTVPEV